MPNLFLTKVWGFDPMVCPALGFATDGGRNKLRREYKPGDWILLAGTKNNMTTKQYRGRLIGKVQIANLLVNVQDVLISVDAPFQTHDFKEDGTFRWPFGLPIIDAEYFIDCPDLKDIFGSYLSGNDWATYAINIADRFDKKVLGIIDGLGTRKAEIIESPIIAKEREASRSFVLNRGGRTGPGPSSTRSGCEVNQNQSFAYVFVLNGGQKNIYKIGFTNNIENRLAFFNKGLVTSVTNYFWSEKKRQSFGNAESAYRFEQELHKKLDKYRIDGEREMYKIELERLETLFIEVFMDKNWAK